MKTTIFFVFIHLFIGMSFAQRSSMSTTIKRSQSPAVVPMVVETKTPKPIGQAVELKNLSAKQYQKKFDELVAKGYSPIKVEVKTLQVIDYTEGEKPSLGYWATFQKFENAYPFVARHALSAQKYQEEFDTWTKQGFIPISVGVGAVEGVESYAVIFQKMPNPPAFVARHGLSKDAFSQEHQALLKQGYKLTCKASCIKQATAIYAAIWTK